LYEECRPEYRIDRPQGLRLPAVEVVVGGQGILTRGEKEEPLRPGRFFTSLPGESVAFASSRAHPLKKYFLAPLQEGEWERSWWSRLDAGEGVDSRNPMIVAGLLEELLHASQSHQTHATKRALSLLEALGALCFGQQEEQRGASRPDALVVRALRHLQGRLVQTPSVEAWAADLGITANHLCRVFRREGLNTPYNELVDRKMRVAYQRLAMGAESVAKVAQELGFEDPFHFSRLFRRRMGIPPSRVLRRDLSSV
jgi:AraC-like DNA-binding protein